MRVYIRGGETEGSKRELLKQAGTVSKSED
jgi:hypothetical protein